MAEERQEALSQRELEQETAQELPDREALSLISGLGPNLSGNPLDMLSGATGSGAAPTTGTPATPTAPTSALPAGTSLPAV